MKEYMIELFRLLRDGWTIRMHFEKVFLRGRHVITCKCATLKSAVETEHRMKDKSAVETELRMKDMTP